MKVLKLIFLIVGVLFFFRIDGLVAAMPENGNKMCFYSLIQLALKPLERIMNISGESKKNIIDLTMTMKPDMLRFPDDPAPIFQTEQLPFGDLTITMSKVTLGVHLGTHVDAPGHFIFGARTVEKIPVSLFVGTVFVIDLSHIQRVITRQDLETKQIPINSKIFIKTRNSLDLELNQYKTDHVYLAEDAANYLVEEKRVQLLGFDYYNIDNGEEHTLPSHLAFAKADIPVMVAVNMSEINADKYQFSAVPLLLSEIEASPVRVIVWQ